MGLALYNISMPESTTNVTTGLGLLHEVFQENVKQSFVSLGYPVYEYDQSSGGYKNTVTGESIGFPVRFPRIRELFTTDYNYSSSMCLTMELGRGIDNVVIAVESVNKDWGEVALRFLQLGNSGEVVFSTFWSYGGHSGTTDFQPRSVFYDIFPNGQVVVIAFGYGFDNQGSPLIIKRGVYNPSSNPPSVSSGQSILPLPLLGTSYAHPVSKVFILDSQSVREYYVLFLLTASNSRSLWILRVVFNKQNNTISAQAKEIVSNLQNYSSSPLVPSEVLPLLTSGDYYGYTGDYWPEVTGWVPRLLGFKVAKQEISSNSFSGNLVFAIKGQRPWNYTQTMFIKVPFSATIDQNNFNNSTFSFFKENARIYGPIEESSAYHNGYLSSDGSRIEFARRSTYVPMQNYLAKIKSLRHPWYSRVFMVINNDIDEDRLSLSVFLYNRHDGYNWYGTNPFSVISSFELTPGGNVYYRGSTYLDQVTFAGGFTLHSHPSNVMLLAQVWTSDINNQYTFSSRLRILAVSFTNDLPSGVQWGTDLPKRNTQPYLVKIKHPNFVSYRMRKDLSDQDKTVFSREDEFYLTSVMWVGMYQSGFFVPYFHAMKRGGDGVWFDPDVLYVGVPSYDHSVVSPGYCFGVNGSPLFWYRDADDGSNHYILGDQVNSSISLVYKLVASPNKESLALVGIQGSNDLKFLRINLFNPYFAYNPHLLPFVLPFGSAIFGNNFAYEHYMLFPMAVLPFFYGARLKGKTYNVRLYKDNLRRNKTFYGWNPSQKEVYHETVLPFNIPPSNIVATTPFLFRLWGDDFHDAWGITPKPLIALSDPTSALFAVDQSNTLRVGDYVQITDSSGNVYNYVVVNQFSDTFYNSTSSGETSTYRALLLIRKD